MIYKVYITDPQDNHFLQVVPGEFSNIQDAREEAKIWVLYYRKTQPNGAGWVRVSKMIGKKQNQPLTVDKYPINMKWSS